MVFSSAFFLSMIVPMLSERETATTFGRVEEIVCSIHPYGYWRSELIAFLSSYAYEVERLMLTGEIVGSIFSPRAFGILEVNFVPVNISILRETFPK